MDSIGIENQNEGARSHCLLHYGVDLGLILREMGEGDWV